MVLTGFRLFEAVSFISALQVFARLLSHRDSLNQDACVIRVNEQPSFIDPGSGIGSFIEI